MDSLLEGLNDAQRQAVCAPDGPVLVLAGPGSGKTRVLTHRIAHLVHDRGVMAGHIMAVTFTNKAAGEMRARATALLGGGDGSLQIGTFHSICARILRIEAEALPYYDREYTIFDTDDQVAATRQAMAELEIDTKKTSPRTIHYLISNAKNEMILPADYPAYDYTGEITQRVYERYQRILQLSNAMDFDDLLLQMALLLRENERVRARYQRRYTHVLVDEFQDTNTVQYQLVRDLGAPHDNVFVVGDEDQSIYAFRGADFRNVLRFQQDFPAAQTILLERNYRSTQTILDAARGVIDRNTNRTPKALWTERHGGDLIRIYEAMDETAEAGFVLEEIEHLRAREGYQYTDFAVMYRTNAQSRAIEEAFIRSRVPYVLVGGVGFYKRREIRDLLAYLRVVNNINDQISLARIINTPRRGIGDKSFQDFQRWAGEADLTYGEAMLGLANGDETTLSAATARKMVDFWAMVSRWRDLAGMGDLVGAYDAILAETGYGLFMTTFSTPEQLVERNENLNELRGLLHNAMEKGWTLNNFLTEQALVSDVDQLDDSGDTVTLLTLHAAKGLEFPVVFIVGVENGLIPHSRSISEGPDQVEEERRLFYVGMTRARHTLNLSYVFRRISRYGGSEGVEPSPFLHDLPLHTLADAPAGLLSDMHRVATQRQVIWDAPPSRLQRDLAAAARPARPPSALGSRIIPFPGGRHDTTFKAGQKVYHPVYGQGMVITSERASDDEEVTIAFTDKKHGVKTVLSSMARLDRLD